MAMYNTTYLRCANCGIYHRIWVGDYEVLLAHLHIIDWTCDLCESIPPRTRYHPCALVLNENIKHTVPHFVTIKELSL